jgi:hypothetical protein
MIGDFQRGLRIRIRIRIQAGQWIRIRNPDPGGQKRRVTKVIFLFNFWS